MEITPGQSRAARAFLNWKQSDTAKAAPCSLATVSKFEQEKHIPMRGTLLLIRQAYEKAGVRFTTNGVEYGG